MEQNIPPKKTTNKLHQKYRSEGVRIRILNLEKNINVSTDSLEKSMKTDLPGSVSPFTSYLKQSQITSVATPESKTNNNPSSWFARGHDNNNNNNKEYF